jgi:hypothetical protein
MYRIETVFTTSKSPNINIHNMSNFPCTPILKRKYKRRRNSTLLSLYRQWFFRLRGFRVFVATTTIIAVPLSLGLLLPWYLSSVTHSSSHSSSMSSWHCLQYGPVPNIFISKRSLESTSIHWSHLVHFPMSEFFMRILHHA